MRSIWNAVQRFFGADHNTQCQALLVELARLAVDCSRHLRDTKGHDLDGIITYERRADEIVDDIRELLDDSFIMRFDIADMMHLTDEIDDVIDNMRKVAMHISIYRKQLAELRPEAEELMGLGATMIEGLAGLIGLLGERRLELTAVREQVRALSEAESRADRIVAEAERQLVTEFSPKDANRLEFLAWDKLYQLLEETTDYVKGCGKHVLSLARKEA
jgi:hypothetical protein